MKQDELYVIHIFIVALVSIVIGCYCKSNFFPSVNHHDIEVLEHDIESLERRVNQQQMSQRQLSRQQELMQNLDHIEATPVYANSLIQTPVAHIIRPDTPMYNRPEYTFSESESDVSSPIVRTRNNFTYE